MDQATYEHQGVVELDSFSLSVREGEIGGLVPVNNYGVEALFSILTQNLPLRHGYVYYREQCVNSRRHYPGGTNRISVIRSESCLAKDLKVAGSWLIVMENIDALVSKSELAKLQEILLHYAGKGIAFLYLSSHFEETLRFCHRTALMSNGRILKCVDLRGSSKDMLSLPCVEDYDRWELIDQLRKRDIAVVILAVNLADSLALAGRLIRLRQGTVHEVYRREDFAKLPINTPWLYLYREKYPPEPTFKERTDEHEMI